MSLSKLRKISKDIIIYSVLATEFELPDFKNDALAGVRANYFKAKCAPQAEKTDIMIDGRPHSLSYSMQRGTPLSWKITCGTRTIQTVKRASDGSYAVLSYGNNGVIYKRQFFDAAHRWLRTEYYSKELENQIAAVIYPQRTDGLIVLRMQRFLQTGIESHDLFPSADSSKKHGAALIYADAGMLWYDTSFKPRQSVQRPAEEPKQEGFRFVRESFTSPNASDLLRLREAAYLGDGDSEPEAEEPAPVQAEQQRPYSAYEQIQNILYEAHKTNKNIFGELASRSSFLLDEEEPFGDEEAPVEKLIPKEAEPLRDNSDKESNTESEPVKDNSSVELNKESAAVPAHDNSNKELSIEPVDELIQNNPEEAPDVKVPTRNGDYAYYGALDENGQRTGRGRTVTPDGLTSYDGGYLADKRDGFGVCYYKEGSPNYVGDWKEGNRSGRGVGFRQSDGTMHAGRWQGNKPDGFGARFDRDGNFLDVCTYVDGKRNGKSVAFDANGNIVVTLWRNGEAISEKIISD